MALLPTVGSVIGPDDAFHWGQVLILPGAYGVIEVGDPKGNAQEHGIAVLGAISKLLETPPDTLHALEAALSDVLPPTITSAVVIVPVDRVVYIVVKGEGSVAVKRKEKFAVILGKEGSISGEVKPGDVAVCFSKTLAKTIAAHELPTLLSGTDTEDQASRATALLYTRSAQGGAGCILAFQGEPEPVAPEMAPPLEETVVAQPSAAILTRESKKSPVQFLQSLKARLKANPFFAGKKSRQTYIAIILVAIFLVSVTLGIVKQVRSSKKQQVDAAVAQANHLVEEANALMPLNPLKGRERLTQAKELLTPLLATISSKSPEGRTLTEAYEHISASLADVLQVHTVTPELYYDVSLVKNGGKVSAVALEDKQIGIIDSGTKSVYAVTLPEKTVEVVAGGDSFAGVSRITLHGDTAYTLVDAGIHAVDIESKQTKKTIIPHDAEWGTIVSFLSFGGNLYLLDTSHSRIWKYVATEKGFTERREYLNPDFFPDLSQATGMAIDGSVWVGTTDGKILRFTQGKENPFTPQGVEPGLANSVVVYTSDENEHVYVLEAAQKRVVVLTKDGVYKAQYRWATPLTPVDLVVSEAEKRLLLLSGGVLYTIPL